MTIRATHPLQTNAKMKQGDVGIVVIRKDGSREVRGRVSYSHTNPVLNFIGGNFYWYRGAALERYYRVKNWIKRRRA